jgi:dTDP-4-amino-4,6-dideoxygalactose transaminase
MKIPLIRSYFPPINEIGKIYSKAYKSGKHSNFGPLFEDAVDYLSKESGRYSLPVSSGTAAIEIACRMKFKPGDKILVPDYTHAGTLVAIKAAGCVPVLADTHLDTWTINLNSLAHWIDGIVAVSPFGFHVHTHNIDEYARINNIPVVYDFAGAWEQFPATKNPVCYSLHATKNFSCGEGGVINFATKKEWEKARWLTNFCNDKDRIVRNLEGRNYKPSEILCAVILTYANNSRTLNKVLEKRDLIDFYCMELGVTSPSYHNFMRGATSLCVVEGITKAQEKKALRHGIEIKQYYTPFPKNICESVARTDLKKVLSRYALPSDATEKEAKKVVEVLKG